MKHYWETKDGESIEFSKLENTHLLNILNWIEKKADEGVTLRHGGYAFDIESIWYEEEHLIGEPVLKHFKHNQLLREALSRDLITTKQFLLRRI